jgi:quercetin dioxygenase-like cupin family protein
MNSRRVVIALAGAVGSAIVSFALARAESPAVPAPSNVAKDLMTKDLVGVPEKEVKMLTVEYVPGGASLPHRHNAQVFVYVLEGSIRMQVAGAPLVTLGPGDTFYEGPHDIHEVSANASSTRTAKILVFMVKNKNAPVSSAVDPK